MTADVLCCRERQKLRREARRGKEKAQTALKDSAGAPPAGASAPPSLLGVVSESFGDALADYIDKNPDGALKDKVGILLHKHVKAWSPHLC